MTTEQRLFVDRLPIYLTRFVGREREIGAVEHLLNRHRVVTVCGVGGAGKTRSGDRVRQPSPIRPG